MNRALSKAGNARRPPNVLFVFSDQHRASSMGCYGDANVRTPNLDRFATQGTQLNAAMSCTPVCVPYRACLMSGQYGHHNGTMSNGAGFVLKSPCIAETFKSAEYQTGYIGKWHLNAAQSKKIGTYSGYVSPDQRLGFDYWRSAQSGHNYYDYTYFEDDNPVPIKTDIYQPTKMTDQAIEFIQQHDREDKPWFLMVSWGPPHPPFKSPAQYRKHYEGDIKLSPNVPEGRPAEAAREILPEYYGLIESLDVEWKRLMEAVDKSGLAEDTIVIYTSDHGEMLGSNGYLRKRWPHEESARVPFLIRYPGKIPAGRMIDDPFNTPDIYTTLAGLAGIKMPDGLDGADYAPLLTGRATAPPRDYAYLQMIYGYVPWPGWRAIRTRTHLYARTADGPWLLFDIQHDPHEMRNLADEPSAAAMLAELDRRLIQIMAEAGDTWKIAAEGGDLDHWHPGHKKFLQHDLGVNWPGKYADAIAGGGHHER